ncbi:MAG: MotA/TolQ/ExbB proton channel family protein [Cyclobacteriaceae bacterium]|nr:MotA/TolQ/ExbB proton channel family protein [Cyclobacteriaceae bacterium]MCH8516682.1 MotA/TolQ/ExbB proton channel family protein [Cyclobacteriaceae bacterium]
MKKLLASLLITGIFAFGFNYQAIAQEDESQEVENVDEMDEVAEDLDEEAANDSIPSTDELVDEEPTTTFEEEEEEELTFHQVVKTKFIEGGWDFMSIVLICLILGLAFAIERIIVLNLATTNTKKLLAQVEEAIQNEGVEKAKEICKNTRGPVASIFTQGLMRMSEGVEMVEKSIVAYGSVEMGKLERNLVWISLFISLAPMLGFMGTVIGMIGAFDAIQAAGDISPSLVAGGIKVALLTTVAGLIVAVILQLFYNYCVSKIDSLVNQMEDASISLVDILVRNNAVK